MKCAVCEELHLSAGPPGASAGEGEVVEGQGEVVEEGGTETPQRLVLSAEIAPSDEGRGNSWGGVAKEHCARENETTAYTPHYSISHALLTSNTYTHYILTVQWCCRVSYWKEQHWR